MVVCNVNIKEKTSDGSWRAVTTVNTKDTYHLQGRILSGGDCTATTGVVRTITFQVDEVDIGSTVSHADGWFALDYKFTQAAGAHKLRAKCVTTGEKPCTTAQYHDREFTISGGFTAYLPILFILAIIFIFGKRLFKK